MRVLDDPWTEETLDSDDPTAPTLQRHLEEGGDPWSLDLRKGLFKGSNLAGLDLTGADLRGATLNHARLTGCILRHARLDFADLSQADLRGADLTRASLTETNLWHADLRGTVMVHCDTVIGASVRGAKYDRLTVWPRSFDPIKAGAKFVQSPPK